MANTPTKAQITPGFLAAHAISIFLLITIAKAALGFKDITEALAFYGVYHRNKWNQLLHFFGVPGIIWSLLIFFAHLRIPTPKQMRAEISIPGIPTHSLSYATVLSLGYLLFYLKIDAFGGTLYAPFVYSMYRSAVIMCANDQDKAAAAAITAREKKEDDASSSSTTLVSWTGTGGALKTAALIHVLSWYVQIHPGHKILEGAAPAITQSFGGALTSAPLFAFYEGLWALGINAQLLERTQGLVAEYTAELCQAGSSMRACADFV